MIAVEAVGKTYGSGEHALAALVDVSFAVREGEFVTLVGPSGCGKSTLLQILAGLVPASTGRVLINGRPVTGPSPDTIGVMFQDAWLLPWKTAVENV
ncbi:MAG TPA: ATP-binding cassette domain-containing protein, partial [Xanthobacteraceae bacterium]|nr:ATP-binding cassette domain-containing protein [Xanthobacteraceae bacterium]